MPARPDSVGLQYRFSQALFDRDQPAPDGIVGPDDKPAPKRFNVYRNNVIVSLTEALADTYPAVVELLGTEYFMAVAREFVQSRPPSSPVLMWYGAEFPAFLESFPPLDAYPYLADVARLEWAWLHAYHAADAAPLDPVRLTEVSTDQVGRICFSRHPAAVGIVSRWPVLSLIAANRFAKEDQIEIDLAAGQAVLVARPDVTVNLRIVPECTAAFFSYLTKGDCLHDAAAQAQQINDSFSLPDSLAALLSAGVFDDLYLNLVENSPQSQPDGVGGMNG